MRKPISKSFQIDPWLHIASWFQPHKHLIQFSSLWEVPLHVAAVRRWCKCCLCWTSKSRVHDVNGRSQWSVLFNGYAACFLCFVTEWRWPTHWSANSNFWWLTHSGKNSETPCFCCNMLEHMKTRSQSLAPLNPNKIKVQTFWDSVNKVFSRALQIVWKMGHGAQVLWNKSLCVVAWCDTGWFSVRLRLPSLDIWNTNFGLCEAPVKHTVTQILLNFWIVKSRDPHKACAQIFELRCNEKLANLLSAQSAAQIGA